MAYFRSQISTLCFSICVADHYQSHHGILLSSSGCLTKGSPKPPSSKQIWNRINGRMHDLHPELESARPLTSPQHGQLGGSLTVLIYHFHPLSNAENGRSSCASLPPTVVIHDPSSSLYSVRLPPINKDRISLSGRMALKKLREEVNFSFK